MGYRFAGAQIYFGPAVRIDVSQPAARPKEQYDFHVRLWRNAMENLTRLEQRRLAEEAKRERDFPFISAAEAKRLRKQQKRRGQVIAAYLDGGPYSDEV